MSKPLKPKRGTTAQNEAFTGEAYEVTLDTQTHRLRTHDGVTAGGFEHALVKDLPSTMTGAQSSKAGTKGLVPAPSAGTQNRPLRGDGTWATRLSCNITGLASKATADANGNNIVSTYATKKDIQALGMPVGSIYLQLAGQAAPADLFGGTWSNVSASYAGLFFRAEGGKAASFGSSQTDGLPDIEGSVFTCGLASIADPTGAFTDLSTTATDYSTAIRTGYGLHLGFKASLYSGIYGAANEVRPANSTIRVWKRTA